MYEGQVRKYLNINIDYTRNDWLTDQAKLMFKDYYLKDDEDVQEGFARAAVAYCDGDYNLAQRIYDYVSRGWFMFASPLLSNAPLDGGRVKSLPISCFLTYVPDSLEGLIDHTSELRWLSVKGGGVGGHWSDIRAVSDVAPGPIPFLKTVDADMSAYKQGKTRKGSYAAYMDISHPDIWEFVHVRIPSGDINRKCLTKGFHNAVNITDDFMRAVINNEEWTLVDPDDGTVRDSMPARKLWEKILEIRYRTGEPYIHFIDRSNENMPWYQRKAGLKVRGSNLCSEITLPTDEDRSAVCCLSSVNVEKFDEWKDTDMIGDLVEFLDNVLQFFIDHAPDELEKARYSAMRERSIGIGMMGWHYYLQSKGIAFESEEAVEENHRVWKEMRARAWKRDKELVDRKGACPDAEDYGAQRRCSNWFAPAPNASSGSLVGTSASIELSPANVYTHRTRAGSHLIKNPHLEKVLESYGKNEKSVWLSILENDGSVQHLDFLSDHEKNVFKTARETDQIWVVKQAAARQNYICQSQSVNLYFPAGVDRAYFNKVHLEAWKQGLKTLYYVRGTTGAKTEKASQKVERVALRDFGEDDGDCKACEG